MTMTILETIGKPKEYIYWYDIATDTKPDIYVIEMRIKMFEINKNKTKQEQMIHLWKKRVEN